MPVIDGNMPPVFSNPHQEALHLFHASPPSDLLVIFEKRARRALSESQRFWLRQDAFKK